MQCLGQILQIFISPIASSKLDPSSSQYFENRFTVFLILVFILCFNISIPFEKLAFWLLSLEIPIQVS